MNDSLATNLRVYL